MKRIELLSPAGSMEALQAAVNAGADAVYIGGSKFSARAYANNFNDEEIIMAIKYCHLYRVKVYVTLNTLIKNDEIYEALEYARFLNKNNVDALIIQDLGLFALIRDNIQGLELHASTQMTVHNSEGALYLNKKGFKRIVLSRELTLPEITYISKDLNIETEIFVHGALCVCYSGQCLMSSLIGGRSGNRGRCAQPCRKKYILDGMGKSHKGYLISPKDMCTLTEIKSLIETGTSSLKIEGRMKKPEYVAGVTDIYRRAIEAAYNDSFFDYEEEEKKLLRLFNREGFSKGYLYDTPSRDFISSSFSKNTGIVLGKVSNDGMIILEEGLNKGDGIRVLDNGAIVEAIIKENEKVDSAKKCDKVKIIPKIYKTNDLVFKTSDQSLLKSLQEKYKDPFGRKIKLNLDVKFKEGEELTLSIDNSEGFETFEEGFKTAFTKYGHENLEFKGDVVEKALNKPLSKEKLLEQLNKVGGTPFIFNFNNIIYEEGFLSASSINKTRRELLTKLKFIYENSPIIKEAVAPIEKSEKNPLTKDFIMPKVLISICKKQQLKAAIEYGFKDILIDPYLRVSDIKIGDIKDYKGLNIYLKVPTVLRMEFNEVIKEIEENILYISGFVTSNLGVINYIKDVPTILDYKSNILNSYTLESYKEPKGAYLSLELAKGEILKVVKKCKSPLGILIYGSPELMITEYCIIKGSFKENNKEACNISCSEEFILTDELGGKFPVVTDRYHRSHIYNGAKLNLIGNLKEIENLNLNYRLDFIKENYEETKDVLNSFIEKKVLDFKGCTRGHFKRGVE